MIVVIGNGKSRQHMDLQEIKNKAWTFGCNALYRDFDPDFLLSIDPHVTHEIVDTDYVLNNILYIKHIIGPLLTCRGLGNFIIKIIWYVFFSSHT